MLIVPHRQSMTYTSASIAIHSSRKHETVQILQSAVRHNKELPLDNTAQEVTHCSNSDKHYDKT